MKSIISILLSIALVLSSCAALAEEPKEIPPDSASPPLTS